MHNRQQTAPRGNRGTVLIVTMWIVLVMAGLVLVLSRSVRVNALASANRVAGLQADSIARGALQYVLSEVDDTQGEPQLDDADCEQVELGNGYYWILKPDLSDDRSNYFGITDEASRLNLNSANMDMLMKLPNMTAELAAAIIDWRDSDSEVTPGGAESEYYLLLDPPYNCKNGPFETIDELLLVRDVTPELLYGEDTNRNGVLDPNEDDADETDPPDNRDGELDSGLAPYITVYSREANTSSDGQERLDINQPPGQDLTDLLGDSMSEDRVVEVLPLARRGRPYQNIFDFYVKTGLQPEEFIPIADRLTTGNQTTLTGMINVNTAPREVLLCLPDLDENDVDALIQKRDDPTADLTSVGWVVEALDPEKAVAIGSYITVRSYQFSADIVAVSGDGRAFRRYRAAIDARNSPPRVVYWRDLTGLGWPLDPQILADLRSGEGLSTTTTLAFGGVR